MEEIKELVKLAKGKRDYHNEIMEITNAIKLHAERNKDLASDAFRTVFPSEPENINKYRIDNITFVTKPFFDKVHGVIEKLRLIPEFNVRFNDQVFGRFCEPIFDLFFDEYLKVMLIDPNAYIFFRPDYKKVYLSDKIVYKSREMIICFDEKIKDSLFYTIFTNDGIYLLEIKGSKHVLTLVYPLSTLKTMVSLGTRFATCENNYYESIIQGVADMWRMAFITYSDLTIGQKQHVFPEKYRYVTNGCNSCGGTGKYLTKDDIYGDYVHTCHACKGNGTVATGMMSEIQINLSETSNALDSFKIPNPPVGYVQKNLEPIEMINSLYQQYIRGGLSAVSMEFLMDIGMNQSGVAKEIDRAEFNGFLANAAKSIAIVLDRMYEAYFSEWVFAETNYSRVQPEISMPKTFDAYYTRSTFDDLRAARDANVNPIMIVETERKIAEEQLSGIELKRALWAYDIDPLPGYSLDQKEQVYAQGNVSKIDYFVSVNIYKLLLEVTNDGYFDTRTDIKKVKALVYESAKQYLSSLSE